MRMTLRFIKADVQEGQPQRAVTGYAALFAANKNTVLLKISPEAYTRLGPFHEGGIYDITPFDQTSHSTGFARPVLSFPDGELFHITRQGIK
jgi:hypothetical protein